MVTENLRFLAGDRALRRIQAEGLNPGMIRAVAGAAGGPKWLMLARMDRFLFQDWLGSDLKDLPLLGSSIGAWRHAVACLPQPAQAFCRFEELYVTQAYPGRPTIEEIKGVTLRIFDSLFPADAVAHILGQKRFRLNVMAARARGILASELKPVQGFGLLAAAFANGVSRRGLAMFFERCLFYHPGQVPPFYPSGDFVLHRVPLEPDNLRDALMASGAIPMAVAGVRNISGAPPGTYRDGGVIDYHFDIPYGIDEGIILLPHFSPGLITGWFDKKLTWRKPRRKNLENVLVVAPSQKFIESLPRGRMPDRMDFDTFRGHNQERIDYWYQILAETNRLADELAHVLGNQEIAARVEPLFN